LAVAQAPRTSYVQAGDLSIAYQTFGEGPFDVFVVPGGIWHVDLLWGDPGYARFMRRLSSYSRVIVHDRRGMGASDPTPQLPTLEDRMQDMLAVMDAADCREVALLGISEGGPTAAWFAASHPDRVRSLVMYGTFAAGERPPGDPDEDYPWEETAAFWDWVEKALGGFGEGFTIDIFASHRDSTELERRLWGAFERTATSPSAMRQTVEHNRAMDVRSVLPAIRVPTLVIHRVNDILPVQAARYIAERIAGARLVELKGTDHIPWLGDVDEVADEIEEFLTGTRSEAEPDRVLATVLFTDIVGSTERAAELGDQRWRALLERHDDLVRERVSRSRGRPVKSLGDGFLATFDGPARAIRCAEAIVEDVRDLGVQVRAGVHTGECERMGDDLGGMAVHVGARIGALAQPGEVLVSSTVRELVAGSGIAFADRGAHELKGIPDHWQVYAVVGHSAPGPAAEPPRPTTADRALISTSRRMPAAARGALRLVRRRGDRR
jgi:class 3 adenylate cyclase